MVAYANEAYNVFWGNKSVDTSYFNSLNGKYLFDTTKEPIANTGTLTMFLLFALIVGVYYLYLRMNAKKLTICRKATLDSYNNNQILEVDQEINQTSSIFYKPQKLYFTSNYIVSSVHGFDIIPFAQVNHVYGYTYGNNKWGTKNSIKVATKDGIIHEIAVIKIDDIGTALYNQIVDQMQMRLPETDFGFENGDFYTAAEVKNTIEIDTVEGEVIKSNVVLGIIWCNYWCYDWWRYMDYHR